MKGTALGGPQRILRPLFLALTLSLPAAAQADDEAECRGDVRPECLLALASAEALHVAERPNVLIADPLVRLLRVQIDLDDLVGAERTLVGLQTPINRALALAALGRWEEARAVAQTEVSAGPQLREIIESAYLRHGLVAGDLDFVTAKSVVQSPPIMNLIGDVAFARLQDGEVAETLALIQPNGPPLDDDPLLRSLYALAQVADAAETRARLGRVLDPTHRADLMVLIGQSEAEAGDLAAARRTFLDARDEALRAPGLRRVPSLLSVAEALLAADFVDDAHDIARTAAEIARPKFFPASPLAGEFRNSPALAADGRIGYLLFLTGDTEAAERAFDTANAIVTAAPDRYWEGSGARNYVSLCLYHALAGNRSCLTDVFARLRAKAADDDDYRRGETLAIAASAMTGFGFYEEALDVVALLDTRDREWSVQILSTVVDRYLDAGEIDMALSISRQNDALSWSSALAERLAIALHEADRTEEARRFLADLGARTEVRTDPNFPGSRELAEVMRLSGLADVQRSLGFDADAQATLASGFAIASDLADHEFRLHAFISLAQAFVPVETSERR